MATITSWPALSYEAFKSTGHLLHMGVQVIGKLKLHTPFNPHWANVGLELTSRGLTSGPIPYNGGIFEIELNFIHHEVTVSASWGNVDKFSLKNMSVAHFTEKLFTILNKFNIHLKINLLPQEIPSPIRFDQDTQERQYDPDLATAWWQILISTYRVMSVYHSRFDGETPPIVLMWGTFDLRDARYNGVHVRPTGINADYIRRRAMDEEQVEVGWWPGNELYPKAAYYSFTYPQPEKIEHAKIMPDFARWDPQLAEFILDYDDLRKTPQPEKNLLAFFDSTYEAGVQLAHWDQKRN